MNIRRIGAIVTLTACIVLAAGVTKPVAAAARPDTIGHDAKVTMTYKLVHAIVSQTAIFGKALFWTQTVPPLHGAVVPERLFSSRVSPIVRHLLFSFPQGSTVLQLQVSQDWIVANLSGTAGSSVWAYNRITHRNRTVDARSVNSGAAIQSVELSGDTLVYVVDKFGQGGHSGTFQIRDVTLPNGAKRLILSRPMKCGQVSVTGIMGDLLVGGISYKCRLSDAVEIDPVDGSVSSLVPGHHYGAPFTNGVTTGWIDYRTDGSGVAATGAIELQNPAGGLPRVISRASSGLDAGCRGGVNRTADMCAELPGITGDLVYWINGAGNPVFYDLATHRSQTLNSAEPPSFEGFGQGFGRYLTWPTSATEPVPNRPQSYIVVARVG